MTLQQDRFSDEEWDWIHNARPAHWTKPHAVYRMFSADGNLLYIGVTSDLRNRINSHDACTDWIGEVATITLEWHDDGDSGYQAETAAIVAERPRYNRNF